MRLKKSIFALFVILALVVGLCVGAGAAGTLDKIEAYLNRGITVKLDNVVQPMYDTKGKAIYPITYNNSTYLPLRAISNMLGVPVDWDAATKTIYLGEKDVVPATRLTDLNYFNKTNNSDGHKYKLVDRAKDNLGNEYTNVMELMEACEEKYWESYMLTEDYTTFSGTLFISYSNRSSRTTCTMSVYGDGQLLYTSPVMTAGVLPVDFSVDISGVDELKVQINGKWSKDYGWLGVYIADPILE